MTLTVSAPGWTFHVELCADQADDEAGYDHDVVSTSLDAEACGDVAMGFVPAGVERE